MARAEIRRTFFWSTVFAIFCLWGVVRGTSMNDEGRLILLVPYALTIGTAVFIHRLAVVRWTIRLPFLASSLANAISLAVFLFVGFVTTIFLYRCVHPDEFGNPFSATHWTLLHGDAWLGLVLAWIMACAVVFLNEMSRRLGPGIFWRWVSGRYHRPRTEERTFLFIDMVGSTSTAEALGSQKFAELLQECFFDATDAIVSTRAEVVNYVGDEIILTWRVRPDGDEPSYEAYRIFVEQLERRKGEYVTRFGLAPKFRGSAHQGVATVAEVGGVRCQLTYLGDALNTCARMLAYAGEVGHEFVASESVASGIEGIQRIGGIELRGKSEKVEVFAFV